MKNLWKVTFDAKYTGLGSPVEEVVKVIADSDGLTAVTKARRQIVGSKFTEYPKGFPVERKCRYVKLTGLELLHKIDA